MALTTAHDDLETCRHPSPPVVPYSKVMPEAIGVPDPQIAVGEKYVLAVDTGRVAFFARTAKSVKLTPVYNNSARAIFTAVQTKLNIRLQVSDPRYKLYCNPAEPEKVLTEKGLAKKGRLIGAPACVTEFYDTPAAFDPVRKKFWIISAARNLLWPCSGVLGAGAFTNLRGLEEIGDSEVKLGFPDPNDLTQTICMPAWSGLAHRFIAVAVSKSGEDPAGGFYTYILVDDYADWPQFTVHDDYLVLNHRAAGSTTYVFDAKTLADGSAGDSSALEIKPLLTIDAAALRARLPFNVPTTALIPATVHGDSDRVTYLAAGFGSLLVVYGLLSPPNHPENAPSFHVSRARLDRKRAPWNDEPARFPERHVALGGLRVRPFGA